MMTQPPENGPEAELGFGPLRLLAVDTRDQGSDNLVVGFSEDFMTLRGKIWIALILALLLLSITALPAAPFYGTISMDPDIILPTDMSALQSVSYSRRDMRLIFDRRTGMAENVERVHILVATFSDGHDIEFRVHPEFESQAAAEKVAARYARLIGQLPNVLRQRLRSVTVLMGTQPFGGDASSGDLLIHVGQASQYNNEGILEEVLVHEACHVSLDVVHTRARAWIEAQRADSDFISIYARDHPLREDVAESFLPYYAYRYRPDRISTEMLKTIEDTIPHRIAYFDAHITLEGQD
jgi:hypothetical protein